MKDITFNKTCTFTEGVGSTLGFVQVWLDKQTSANLPTGRQVANPGCGSGWTNNFQL